MNIITLDVVDKTMLSFVKTVAGSYPGYTFKFTRAGVVQVKSKSELLAELSMFHIYKGSAILEQIGISTEKLKKTTRRGAIKTKDVKKALVYFAKHVVPKTAQESMEECERTAKHGVDYLRRSQRQLALDQFEKLILNSSNLQQTVQDVAGVLDLSSWCTTVETIKKLELDGVMVLYRDDKYVISYKRKTPATPLECTADTLPYNLRASLALLKLVDKGTVILDRGVRINDDLFFVLEEKDA